MSGRSPKAHDSENKDQLELLARVSVRDRNALATLYRIYHPRLFRFIYKMTGNYESTEELINDIMLVVWNKAAEFRGESRVSTWIFGIAYKTSLNRVSRRKPAMLPLESAPEPANDDSEQQEKQDWIMHGVQNLSPTHQATVLLVFYLGLSYDEVAVISDCPVNTVKTRMFHARKNLKLHLEHLDEKHTLGQGGSDE